MKAYFTKDYSKGFSTGIYQNFTECVDFRYLCFQIRGIGQLAFYWNR